MKRIYSPEEATGFDWDEHNVVKNWERHNVSYWKCEEVFFNNPLIILYDKDHSDDEMRYCALGKSDSSRKLFVSFAMRGTLLRPVSFRDMTRKELYKLNISKKSKVPKFKSEDEERDFWAENDSTDFIDWDKWNVTQIRNLKPSVHSISLRLPDALLSKLKILANKKDVPYQTLLKMYLSERVAQEFMAV